MTNDRVFAIKFAKVYPLYVQSTIRSCRRSATWTN